MSKQIFETQDIVKDFFNLEARRIIRVNTKQKFNRTKQEGIMGVAKAAPKKRGK
jgi:hypothetical protein